MDDSDTSAESADTGTPDLKDYGISYRDLQLENFDLIAKVNELLREHKLYDPDGTYTFNDGERWARLDIGETDEADGS